MVKVVLYGDGDDSKFIKKKIDEDVYEIIAIVDKKYEASFCDNGIIYGNPNEFKNYEFDYVAICTSKYFEQIRELLIGEYFVKDEKIISGFCLLNRVFDLGIKGINSIVRLNGIKSILDFGMRVIPQYYSAETTPFGVDVIFDGYDDELKFQEYNMYDSIYTDLNKLGNYEAILLYENIDQLKYINDKIHYRYIIYVYYNIMTEECLNRIKNYGQCTSYKDAKFNILLIDTTPINDVNNLKKEIYVVTHKRYLIQENSIYKALCVGKYNNEKYLSEYKGENISFLNNKINECTAMYWMWKNSVADIIGLNHYRRFFYNDGWQCRDNKLDDKNIESYLSEVDIILPEKEIFYGLTVKEQLKDSLDIDVFEYGFKLIVDILKKLQPEYVETFQNVMNGHKMYPCNMFVARREVICDYFEWLFSFLIPVAKIAEVDKFDLYNKRVIGFFAERMLTVWLKKQKMRVKELPIFKF